MIAVPEEPKRLERATVESIADELSLIQGDVSEPGVQGSSPVAVLCPPFRGLVGSAVTYRGVGESLEPSARRHEFC